MPRQVPLTKQAIRDLIVAAIKGHGPITAGEVAKMLGCSTWGVSQHLQTLMNQKRIEKASYWRYQAPAKREEAP